MKIAFFDLAGWEISFINKCCKELGLDLVIASTEPFSFTHVNKIKNVDILSVFLSKVDQTIIQELSCLKLISIRATGFDQVDAAFAKKMGIAVTYLPAYADTTVAEYALALILMIAKGLNVTYKQSLVGTFDQKAIRCSDLAGKTVGVIGTGRIGCKFIKMINGFDVNILCYDILPKTEMINLYKVKYVSLEELFKNSDIISIHLSYNKDTHHIINSDNLKLLKKGVLLVNTARGPIVDISAIRQGLKDGIFGGVAMDTFEGEKIWIHEEELLDKTLEIPLVMDFKQAIEAFSLLKFDNVILTPHNAFNSHESMKRMIETTIYDIATFCKSGNCANRIV